MSTQALHVFKGCRSIFLLQITEKRAL